MERYYGLIMKKYLFFLLLLPAFAVPQFVWAGQNGNGFGIVAEVPFTAAKNQGNTGTCWSFATTSFFESELLRMGKGEFDLSEMYFVRQTYLNKVRNFLYYHGKNNFSQGGQAHDVLAVVASHGIVPDTVFPGVKHNGRFSHGELAKTLQTVAEKRNGESKDFSTVNLAPFEPLLDRELGPQPAAFLYEGKTFTAGSFRDFLGIDPDQYVELTSYTHHPFYKPFVLEIPDNWSHNLYYNLPVDELVAVMVHALQNGYSVCWDGDTSEKDFSHRKGVADLPEEQLGKVTQQLRQETFENRETTDDHLMHVVGISEDRNGRRHFYTKNSWGAKSNSLDGMLHLSEDYVRLKTVAILVHRDALPAGTAQKLNLR